VLPRARVHLPGADGRAHPVDVEVAADDLSRARGLMFRRELPEGTGMLFVFPEEEVQAFWMRNTLLPLDMLFIDAAGVLVGLVSRAVPHSLAPRSVGLPSRYVLEVPGGWAEAHGVRPGVRVAFEGLEGLAVR
jgi:uncharacterized membrane protein (UPF0127 family)